MSKILKEIELEEDGILTIHGVLAMLPTDNECDKLAESGANMYVPDKWADGYEQGYLNALMQIKEELELLAEGN